VGNRARTLSTDARIEDVNGTGSLMGEHGDIPTPLSSAAVRLSIHVGMAFACPWREDARPL
jgi:hypothetical protein